MDDLAVLVLAFVVFGVGIVYCINTVKVDSITIVLVFVSKCEVLGNCYLLLIARFLLISLCFASHNQT